MVPNACAYSNLGTLYFDAGEYARAADAYEKALGIDASDYVVSLNLGNALYWAGDKQRARSTYEQVAAMIEERLKVDAEQPQLLANLAVVLAETSRREEALPVVTKAIQMAPNNVEVMISAAEAYSSLGNSSDAVSLIEKAMRAGYPRAEIERNPSLRRLLPAVPQRRGG